MQFKKLSNINIVKYLFNIIGWSIHNSECKQTQKDFIKQDINCYKNLVYSYYFSDDFNEKSHFSIGTLYKDEKIMKSNNISTMSRWMKFEEDNGEQNLEDILKLIHNNQIKISSFTKRPVISYISAIHMPINSSKININESDIKWIEDMLADIPKDVKEIDFILHSNGGYIRSAHKIVDILRERFKKVNILVPYAAYSAASMLCMSADNIIMTPEGSLTPYDSQILAPDNSDTYLPANAMIKCAKEAKRAHNPFCIFMPKSLYKDWDLKMIKNTILFSKISIQESKIYPYYWLMKYMFKATNLSNNHLTKFLMIPFWKLFSNSGRKANKIVKTFINVGVKLSHNTPIMYSDLKSMGLNVSLADGELLELMRENYILSDAMFERSSLTKLYISNYKYSYRYINLNKEHVES